MVLDLLECARKAFPRFVDVLRGRELHETGWQEDRRIRVLASTVYKALISSGKCYLHVLEASVSVIPGMQ